MKQKLLKTMLLLSALVAGTSSVWAAEKTYSYTFNASSGISKGDNTLGGITWNINHDSSYNSNDATGYHVGSGSKSVSYLQLSTSDIPGTISKVVVNAKGNGSSGTVSVSVNDDDYTATDDAITNSFKDFEFTGSSKGEIVIRLSYPSAVTNNFYIASVDVTYEETAPGTVDTPTFSPAAGPVERNTKVTISSTDGATIYYTTDGSEPTTSSSVYSVAITIDAAKTIKAFAVKSGLTDSEVATAAYTIAKVATPTFDPAAGEVDKDSEITISCETAGATIYYTTDGSIPTASSTAYNPASKPTIDDDKTIKAIAVKTNYIDSDVSTAVYTYARVKDYNLVTSASQIVSGKHYLIASGKADGSVYMMKDQNDNNRGYESVTVSSGVISKKGAREFVIQGPDADGYYTIYDPTVSKYLYAASSTKNYLKSQTTIDDNSRWSIAINGTTSEATIVAQGTNSNKYIRYNYNNGSPIFSCYSSSSALPLVYLFVLDGEETPSESVTVTSAGYATYASENALDFTGKSIEAYIATTKGDGTGVNFTRKYKIPAREGVLLHADGGATVDIPSLAGGTSADAVTGNKFVKGTGAAVATDGTTVWNYILNKIGGNIGFYKAAGQKVAKNRAYLSILQSESASTKEFISIDFEDDATSIQNSKFEIQNEEAPIYNLAGQRLSKMQKGINIVNGKKIMVK